MRLNQVDLVRHGENGLLFPPEQIDQFAASLRSYGADRALRVRHGQAGRRLACARSWRDQVDRLLEHYREASNGRVACPPALAA
ncbi:MAG: hypothetical protein JO023_13945 [Chloroflexi bacterium]|nr:hypothetical protein [Chloroflexota bacterium]